MQPIALIENHMRTTNLELLPNTRRVLQLTFHAFSLINRITTYELFLSDVSPEECVILRTWWDYFGDLNTWLRDGFPHPWQLVPDPTRFHQRKVQTNYEMILEMMSPLMKTPLPLIPTPNMEDAAANEKLTGGICELAFGYEFPQSRFRWIHLPQSWSDLQPIIDDLHAELDTHLYD